MRTKLHTQPHTPLSLVRTMLHALIVAAMLAGLFSLPVGTSVANLFADSGNVLLPPLAEVIDVMESALPAPAAALAAPGESALHAASDVGPPLVESIPGSALSEVGMEIVAQAVSTGTLIVHKATMPIVNCAEITAGDIDTACAAVDLTSGDDTDTFQFTSDISTTDSITPTFELGIGDVVTFTNVISGVYNITETTTAGWELAETSCSTGDDPGSVSVASGATVTCTFTNTVAPNAQFGDRVFIESDGDGLASTGVITPVVGMVITATDGTNVYTTTTDADGYYGFTVPGDVTYTVTYGEVPVQYGSVTPSATPGGNSESGDAGSYAEAGNPDESHENGTTVYVGVGEANWHIDFAFWTPEAEITLEKSTNGEDADTVTGPMIAVGDTVTWTYAFTNTGNVTLTNVTLSDDQEETAGTTCAPVALGGDLAPGMGTVCTLTGVAVAGQYSNTAVVTGTPTITGTPPVTSTDPSHCVTPAQFGDRVFIEDDGDGLASTGVITPVAGMVITATDGTNVYTTTTNTEGYYSFTVPAETYTVTYGTVPAEYGEVMPSDTPGGSSESGDAGTYAEGGNPDQSHENNTTVTLAAGESNWLIDFAFWTPEAEITLEKSTNGEDADTPTGPSINVGDTVTWTYEIVNTGNVTLTDVTLVDDQEGLVATCPETDLAPGAGMTCVLTGVAVAGQYSNTAVVTGTPTITGTPPVTSTDPSHHVGEVFDLALRKVLAEGQSRAVMPGEEITFTIVVSNQGTVDAYNLEITEYLPDGLSLSGSDSNGWNGSGSVVTNTLITTLTAGSETTLDIVTVLSEPFIGTSVTNYAEISDADDDTDPTNEPPEDIDSTPDDDPDNDDNVKDDVTDEDGTQPGQDEDDHDPETVTVGEEILGAIGNYVWVDENSDGYQDAGEPGIPNVRVVLYDDQGNLVAETRTDSSGHYLFPDLPLGDYFVDVDESTTPAGMTQTPPSTLEGADFGNQDHSDDPANDDYGYPATITAEARENLTADFGYNYTEEGDILAALGDRVWIDSNGDGAQDPEEIGVEGVVLTLYGDVDGDGEFTTVVATTTTDANGFYIFDELEPGAYVVIVTDSNDATHDVLDGTTYDQSGDPDHFGQPENTAPTGTANDHTSTVPVVLGPGDVFLNVDFGYQPEPEVTLGSIGDTVWLDADADGNGPAQPPVDGGAPENQGAGGEDDASEYGIVGVTVSLIDDVNGDGVWQPATEPLIATDVTDENGQYLFTDLPLGDYIVWVNDTENVLSELVPTYDYDDGTSAPDNQSARTLTEAEPDPRDQDFGYTPEDQTPALGLIGDTVWFDVDGSGGDQSTQGDEPGLEGVIMELLDSNGDVIATTTTDENGNYYFGGLPLDETYRVRVASENFDPGGVLEGLTSTFDPDEDLDSVGPTVTLTAANPVNLEQDFSYTYEPPVGEPVGRIGNLAWLDPNANGLYEPELGETPIGGVTVDLYRDLNGNGTLDAGEPRLASTVTVDTIDTGTYGTDGNYIFEGLPAGDYIVDVSDNDSVLAGYWKSDGPNDGADNNSQIDPYAVTIAAGGEDLTADFGYYVLAAAVGNYVWLDTDYDGTQNDGETGLNDVVVVLDITYPDGTETKLVTTTGPDPENGNAGWYSFGNLLLDEDYNGDGAGPEPTFVISVIEPDGYSPTQIDVGADDLVDSDDHDGVTAQPIQGQIDTNRSNDGSTIASYDFGFIIPGAVGNYVWLDENSDGVQDAGEAGIANVRLLLKDRSGNILDETYTNNNGYYLFPDLPPGTYCVDVDETTLRDGLEQTPYNNRNADYGNQDHSRSTGYCMRIGNGRDLVNLTADFGYNYTAALGDLVWIDSDADGVADDNEVGVSGVELTLYHDPDGDGTYDTPYTVDGYSPTTTTDENGYYIFDNLEPGAYKVRVTDSTNASHDVLDPDAYDQTGDPDHFAQPESEATPGTANDHFSTEPVVLGPGDVFLNVDFGYTPGPDTVLGTIGDTIWFDADADGSGESLPDYRSDDTTPVTQGAGGTADPGEYGFAGVVVALIEDTNGDGTWDPDGADDIPGTADDEPIRATTMTDINGRYIFEGLPLSNSADGDAGDADYIVWVQDTENVLDGLAQTYDDDGLSTPDMSTATLSPDTPDLRDQDFGYTLKDIKPGLGYIGDTVWYDQDASGGDQSTQGGPGGEPFLSDILMELLDEEGNVIATTSTDDNGHYLFYNLPLNATYQVRVAASNFEEDAALGQYELTYDPDETMYSVGPLVTLTDEIPFNLEQDFSYTPSGGNTGASDALSGDASLGNIVWFDPDAQGDYEGDETASAASVSAVPDPETPFGRVRMLLYRDLNGNGLVDPEDPLFRTMSTAGLVDADAFGVNGTYLFTGLPAGDYLVQLIDPNGVLNGFTKSYGRFPTTDDESQFTPYAITLEVGGQNLTADFGYYLPEASLGNWVWLDVNQDGVQNDGDTGINGVRVRLDIVYPTGEEVTMYTLTGPEPESGRSGWYKFSNLLLDSKYDMPGAEQPVFTLSVETPEGYQPTAVDVGIDDSLDSDDHTGVVAVPQQGEGDVVLDDVLGTPVASYDFGFYAEVFDLELQKTLSPEQSTTIRLGDDIIFHITVQNQGSIDAYRIEVMDVLPEGLTLSVNDDNGWASTDADNIVTQVIDSLPVGEEVVLELIATLDASFTGNSITNVSEIASADDDQNADNEPPTDIDSTPDRDPDNDDAGEDDISLANIVVAPPSTSIGDRVWFDANRNGIQDEGEAGLAGVMVQLYNGDGVAVAEMETDASGYFLFEGLTPGDYRLRFLTPDGYEPSPLDFREDDSLDSDAALDTGYTEMTLLEPGEIDLNWDAGFYQTPTSLDETEESGPPSWATDYIYLPVIR